MLEMAAMANRQALILDDNMKRQVILNASNVLSEAAMNNQPTSPSLDASSSMWSVEGYRDSG